MSNILLGDVESGNHQFEIMFFAVFILHSSSTNKNSKLNQGKIIKLNIHV